MDYKYECALFFPGGDKPEDLINYGRIEVIIYDSKSPHVESNFDISFVNSAYINSYINFNKKIKNSYLLIIHKADAQRIYNFIKTMFDICMVRSNKIVYDAFFDFGELSCGGTEWADAGRISQAARNNYLPYLYWTFEDGSQTYISSEATFFDERILIKVVWPTDFGTDSFDGCWYVTSPSFLQERIKTYDPYYRRHLVITDRFDKEQLENELRKKILTPLIEIPPHVRQLFLKRNMEYQGQLSIGER